jgi:hypothetical protein
MFFTFPEIISVQYFVPIFASFCVKIVTTVHGKRLNLCATCSVGLSVSVQLKKPEVMLFADLSQHNGHALLLRTEFLIDYSRHPGRDSLVCSLAGLQILSKLQGRNKQPPHLVKLVFNLACFVLIFLSVHYVLYVVPFMNIPS